MPDAELVQRIAVSTGLSTEESARVVADIVAYFRESAEDYVRRRHATLQAHGLKNPQIFHRVSTELAERVVAPPVLSDRQLRRIVYG
jgi:hypothetical protein